MMLIKDKHGYGSYGKTREEDFKVAGKKREELVKLMEI